MEEFSHPPMTEIVKEQDQRYDSDDHGQNDDKEWDEAFDVGEDDDPDRDYELDDDPTPNDDPDVDQGW